MTDTSSIQSLSNLYLSHHPNECAAIMEKMDPRQIASDLDRYSAQDMARVWQYLTPGFAESLMKYSDIKTLCDLMPYLDISRSAAILRRLPTVEQEKILKALPEAFSSEISQLIHYPEDSIGTLMDPKTLVYRANTSVNQALLKVRKLKPKDVQRIYVMDENQRPLGYVELYNLALADAKDQLGNIMRPVNVFISEMANREDAVDLFEKFKIIELPVIDGQERLVGVIRQSAIIQAVQEETSADIQTMVGASKDEKALSKITFAVSKRLPWLQINLLTAFMAASVVGLFESTIAKFTALAVLLPVVAGQSGNAGAQALAVTMRGLALREITTRHWLQVLIKETLVGFYNGIAVALTTGLGVYIWSHSFGLSLIIAVSMIIAMVAAGMSGAFIPITLRRLGQDPAQSSSIILTTVTDIVGFLSFLGIATLLSGLL